MIDMPKTPTPAYEQLLTQKLLECGLRDGGFTVKYENDLRSVEIVIEKSAGASAEQFDCIARAAGHEIVTFNDPELQQAYDEREFEALRPKRLAVARAELERRGLLDGFPERSNFGSDKLFAEALERQCGLAPGSFFVQTKSGLVGRPGFGRQSKADLTKLSCLIAAVTYVSAKGEDFTYNFIGNQAVAPRK